MCDCVSLRLMKDAVSWWHFMVWTDTSSDQCIDRDVERSDRCLIWGTLLEGLWKTTNTRQDSGSAGWHLNPRPRRIRTVLRGPMMIITVYHLHDVIYRVLQTSRSSAYNFRNVFWRRLRISILSRTVPSLSLFFLMQMLQKDLKIRNDRVLVRALQVVTVALL